jgi:uridine kinase
MQLLTVAGAGRQVLGQRMKTPLPGLPPQLVAIAGPSGAGKSWLASELKARLGKEAALLRLDDFYLDRSNLSLARRSQINFDHPRAVDWTEFEQVLLQCKAGQAVRAPRYDFTRHCRHERTAWLRPRPIVLVEGLWLLRRASIRRLFALRIYLGCPSSVQLRRRLRRDARERGRSPAVIRKQFFARVAPMAERYVAPQARWADEILTSPVRPGRIDRLVERLRGVLLAGTERRAGTLAGAGLAMKT